MSCNDIPSLLDLQNTKKHIDDFGRLVEGTESGYSTNGVTGQIRPTYNKVINDMNSEFDGMIVDMNSEFDQQIQNLGYTRVGTFASGATLLNGRQTLLWDIADGGDGQEYGWSGAFPPSGKVVPPGSTPLTTGGIAVGAWMSRFDPALRVQTREALRRSYAEAGYNLVAGSFEAGGTVTTATDVLIYEAEGKAYGWGGSFPKSVDEGSSPSSAGGISPGAWTDMSNKLLRDDLYSDNVIHLRKFLNIAADHNAAFELAMGMVENTVRTPAFPAGGATIIFPDITINRPVIINKLGVKIVGEHPGTTVTVDPVFTADTGPDALGKWCFIADSKYTTLQMDIYGVYVGDFTIDYQYNTDVKGVLINGGRNTSTVGTINHQRAANTLVRLGKSSLSVDSITQGVRVYQQWMLHDGNPGQIIPAINCSAIDLAAANECSIVEPTIVPAPRWDIRMVPITVGSGTYQCGGNIVHDGVYSNVKSVQYVIADASGVIVGSELTTADGHTLIVQNISGATISGITKAGSAYIPRVGDTITKSGGGSTTISAVNYITPCVKLRNSWGTQLMPARAAENCTLYVDMDAGAGLTATNCQSNRVWPARQFSTTSSCYARAALCQFNRIDVPTYVNAVVIENSANQCLVELIQGGQSPRVKNLSSTSYVIGWSNSGLTLTPGASGVATVSFGGFGTVSADVNGLNLLTTAQIRMRDSAGVTRVQIDSSKNVFVYDAGSVERLGVTSDGKLLMRNLPTANPGTAGQVWKNGTVLNVV